MPTYATPGVYIEEVSTLPPSVAQVPSAIPAFLGVTEKRAQDAVGKDLTGFVKIESLVEYQAKFGGTVEADSDNRSYLFTSVRLFYANGGGDAYIYSVATAVSDATVAGYLAGLELLKKESEPTLILFPDAVCLTIDDGLSQVQQASLALCEKMGNRFTILDVPSPNTMLTSAEDFRRKIGMTHLSYGAAYGPWLNVMSLEGSATEQKSLDALQKVVNEAQKAVAAAQDQQKKVADALAAAKAGLDLLTVPASGAIAGIYAAVDAERGVWKAPANVSLSCVLSVTEIINDHDQESLNVDSASGKSLNAIRSFPGKGVLVWGARTLDGNNESWRYVPVRRLFIMVEESIRRATGYVVFEPNDSHTWVMVKAMIENFLADLWQQGALAGSKPEQAFFVNVGLGTSMTAEDILNGRLVINVGMAAVRPAEFVIIRFSHLLQQA